MYSRRMGSLPPYLFARIDELKEEQVRRGVDVIDLGIGDPDLPTPAHVVEALCRAARDPANHHYPSYAGMSGFREAACLPLGFLSPGSKGLSPRRTPDRSRDLPFPPDRRD